MVDNETPPEVMQFLANPEPAVPEQSAPSEQMETPPEILKFIEPELKEAQYGTPTQIAKTALEGAGQGLLGPLAPMAEEALGVNPEDIRARAEVNPGTHFTGEVAGLVAPAVLTGGGTGLLSTAAKFTQAGAIDAIAAKLIPVAGETLAAKIGTGAAKAAVENMLFGGSDEASKLILNDPNQSVQSAITSIGLAGALGGVFGAGAKTVESALEHSSLGKLAADFKARIQDHINNPDPVSSMTDELSKYYTDITKHADEVYGTVGLKSKAVEAAMPEMSEKITDKANEIYNKVNDALKPMIEDQYRYPPRLTMRLKSDLDNFTLAVSKDNVAPKDIFNAAQDLKQTLQSYSKFDKFVKPTDDAYDFVKTAKGLSHDLRTSLEDPEIWGKAAKVQQDINGAFKDYLPTLKDFEKKFTTVVSGEKQIDPGKVMTYLNQVSNPRAEIKQTMLKNFIDASENYKKVISDIHSKLGAESPVLETPLNTTMASLEKKTLGSKLADAFIDRGLTEAGGKTIGGAIGAGGAKLFGLHGELGAILGAHALGPFFSSVLPGLAKSIVGKEVSPAGLKAASIYGAHVADGVKLADKAASAIFKEGSKVLADHMIPSDKDRENIVKQLKALQTNPEQQIDNIPKINDYLPDHGNLLNSTTTFALSYLNSLRADQDKKAPLDSKPVLSNTQKSQFKNALDIAQQPLVVLDKLKKGTLTAQDITHMNSMYPNLYNQLKQKVTEEMVNHIDKGNTVPYKTKMGLSLFLGQPLDSTMTPGAIQ